MYISYHPKVNYAIFVFVAFACLVTFGGSAARFVAMGIILALVSATAYIAFRILKLALKLVKPALKAFLLAIIPEAKTVPSTPVVVESAQPKEESDFRITEAKKANVKRQMSGEQICDIPAYARKAQGIHFPITVEVLNRPKFVIA